MEREHPLERDLRWLLVGTFVAVVILGWTLLRPGVAY